MSSFFNVLVIIIFLSSLVFFLSITDSFISTPWETVAPTLPELAPPSAGLPAVYLIRATVPTMPSITSSSLVATTVSSLRSRFSLSFQIFFNFFHYVTIQTTSIRLIAQLLCKRAFSNCNGVLFLSFSFTSQLSFSASGLRDRDVLSKVCRFNSSIHQSQARFSVFHSFILIYCCYSLLLLIIVIQEKLNNQRNLAYVDH